MHKNMYYFYYAHQKKCLCYRKKNLLHLSVKFISMQKKGSIILFIKVLHSRVGMVSFAYYLIYVHIRGDKQNTWIMIIWKHWHLSCAFHFWGMLNVIKQIVALNLQNDWPTTYDVYIYNTYIRKSEWMDVLIYRFGSSE